METQPKEPLFNIPPLTMWIAIILILIFGVLQIPSVFEFIVPILCFIPEIFTQHPLQESYTLLGYALLHFGWPHIATNIAGLLAFGSGVERLLGRKWFMVIFVAGTIFGALGHWALFPHETDPLGGASAGISALFGAVLPLLVKRRDLIMANVVFILTNLAIGLMGVPNEPGMSIAWQAHIVGFILGQIIVFFILKKIPQTEQE